MVGNFCGRLSAILLGGSLAARLLMAEAVMQPVDPAHQRATNQAAPLQILDLSGFGFTDSYTLVYAASVPVAGRLGDLTVLVNGVPAPILFASKTSVRIQIPDMAEGVATVTAMRDGGWRATAPLQIVPESLVIFDALSAAGAALVGSYGLRCMSVQNWIISAGMDPQIRQLGCDEAGKPSRDGQVYVVLYGTGGMGSAVPRVGCGNLPDVGSVSSLIPSSVTVAGIPISPDALIWHGPAPGLVGVDAYVVRLPAELPQGVQATPRNLQVILNGQRLNIYEGSVVM